MADRVIEHVIAASAVRDTDSQSDWFDVQDCFEGTIVVDVTAIDGGDTIDLTVEATDLAGSSTYVYTHSTFTQITATGKSFKALTNFGGKIRLKWNVTVAAAPSITFSAKFIGKSRL